MNKCAFVKFFLFFTIILLCASCKKDIAGKVEGVYFGEATIVPFGGPGNTQTFPGGKAVVTKLTKTNVRIEITSSAPEFVLGMEKTLRKDGSFDDGLKAPRGSLFVYGTEGKISGNSFSYSFARADSLGLFSIYTFAGRKD